MDPHAEPVEIVEHDPAWPARFAEEAARIRAGLGSAALRIEHIGSTAVKGLSAKPVIDIQISVKSFEPEEIFLAPLEGLGYRYVADAEPQHRFFRFPSIGPSLFHVHVCEAGSSWEGRHLRFRDHLRSHPRVAAEYAELKRSLAERYRHDRDGYVEAKGPFISRIDQAAETGSATN